MCRRRGRLAAAALLLPFLCAFAAAPEARAAPVTVAIVTDGPPVHADAIPLFIDEIRALVRNEFDVRFPEDKRLNGGGTVEGVARAVDTVLADPSVDLVLALDLVATQNIAHRGPLKKPAIGAAVADVALQEMPYRDGRSGVHNLNYVASYENVERDLRALLELTGARRVAILVDALYLEAIPRLTVRARTLEAGLGIQVDVVPVTDDVDATLAHIPPEAEAVYLTYTPLPTAAVRRLIEGINARHLPSFSMRGRAEVALGVMAGMAAEREHAQLARRVALHVQRVLLGEDPGKLPVAFAQQRRLVVNMETVRAIDRWPPWQAVIGADLLHAEADTARVLSLGNAVQEAVEANLQVVASARDVAAGAAGVRRSLAPLLPQLSANVAGVVIDDDRAAISQGQQAERTLQAGADLSQLLYSDAPLAAYQSERHLQAARAADLASVRLDIAQAAATAYLNVLKAKTLEDIRGRDRERTRRNLELAEARQAIGHSGPADVYRWESQLATAQKDLFAAQAQRRQAEVALNRVLHRPLEEPFGTAETGLADPELFVADPRFFDYIRTLKRFAVFRDFVVAEGLAAAPEVASLDAAIRAQERAVTASRRAYFAPVVGLTGNVTERIDQSGAGDIPTPADDTDWSVILSASLPLTTGGGRGAGLRQANADLEGLKARRAAAAESVEARIRTGLHATSATYPAIDLTAQAAEAARRNLDLVTDAYERGVVAVIDLVDAQNAALVAELAAASAVYDFLIDLMEVQRASAWIDFLHTGAEREAWFGRLADFFAAHPEPPQAVP